MFQDLLITVTGDKSLYIENYKNMIDYKDDLILIQGRIMSVRITGTDFLIEYFTSESMRIKGQVQKIEFMTKTKKEHKEVL